MTYGYGSTRIKGKDTAFYLKFETYAARVDRFKKLVSLDRTYEPLTLRNCVTILQTLCKHPAITLWQKRTLNYKRNILL